MWKGIGLLTLMLLVWGALLCEMKLIFDDVVKIQRQLGE